MLAKVGVRAIDSNLATAIRTVVTLIFAWAIALARATQPLASIAPRTFLFLELSGAGDGAIMAELLSSAAARRGVAGGSRRQAERGRSHGAGGAVPWRTIDLAALAGRGPDYPGKFGAVPRLARALPRNHRGVVVKLQDLCQGLPSTLALTETS